MRELRREIEIDAPPAGFTQAERFSGILVGLFKSTLDKTELGFEQMNAALKTRAERRLSRFAAGILT